MLGVALFGSMQAQTYKVGSNPAATPQQKKTQAPSQPLGFGSNIQNARLARAAELALHHGDRAKALGYAQRAAQAAPGDPRLWFLVGYAARLNRQYQLSVDSYDRGLRISPSAVEGLSGLAQTYSLMGRTDEAMKLLEQVIASNPNRRDDALLLGNLYMRTGDYNEALPWLKRAERLRQDARSELLLAISYQRLQKMDLANHYLNLAKQRAPDNPDVQRTFAGYYRQLGNYPAAIAALKSIRNPKPDVKAELAFTYQLNGQPEQAADLYAQAANARPKDLGLQLSAAQARIATGSIEGAQTFLQRAKALNPNYYRLHAILGEIAQLEDRTADAVEEYRAALANLPASPVEGPLYGIQLHVDLMELYRGQNDDARARQELQTAQTEIGALNEQGASRAPFLRLRALIKMNAGDVNGALTDINEALSLAPHDPNNLQLNGDILMKLGRTEDAIVVYKKVLAMDPKNRSALTSLGYASRDVGRYTDARNYFLRLAKAFPMLYIPYLALGDMYASEHQFNRAEAAYLKAHSLAPHNTLIVAGGMNAAIEAHKLDLAATWLGRATSAMLREPQMLKQQERYLRLKGDYAQSVVLGQEAIKVLPQDRDVVVYLAYDLLQLGKYDELKQLTSTYRTAFPKDADIPLLAGYVNKHDGNLEQARKDFSEAIARDPKVATAYVNRGYVLNDLHQPAAAAADFEAAIKLQPKNGEAHLGLAYADLDLDRPGAAIRESQVAEKESGDSEAVHVIRATAYGREGLLTKSIAEFRAALKFAPNDPALYLGLGNALFSGRRYREAVAQLQTAAKLAPREAAIYALLARATAYLNNRAQTLHYIQLAEQYAQQTPPGTANKASGLSEVYLSTGEAFSTLGDERAAIDRFTKALNVPDSDRVEVRLAIARLMAQQDNPSGAERQIALAMMEAEAHETAAPTGLQYVNAADIFRQIHELELSQTYLGHAKTAGAPDIVVRVGLANNYLAMGDTARAAAELAAVSQEAHDSSNYQFLLAQASVYQQQHHGAQALTSLGQASTVGGEDPSVEQDMLATAANEGFDINPTLSVLGNFTVLPIYEPSTVYVLDAKLDGPVPLPPTDIALLPPPRYSLDKQGTAAFHLHFNHFVPTSGFFQVSNARGTISVPATSSIARRSTTDYTLSFGVNPTVRLGRNAITFDGGIQGTIRRDSLSPRQLNQNLFREFVYLSTTSFFNVVSASGHLIYESGPFTESDIHSKALFSAIDFRVGAPWGKTALVTGWGSNDQQFTPVGVEDYYTSSYIGLNRRFSRRFSAEGLAEDLRTWRVVGSKSGVAQALRPVGTFDFTPTPSWDVHVSGSYSSTRSFHVYDAIDDGISVSYVRGLRHSIDSDTGEVTVRYPIRFAAGFQQQSFFNFTRGQNKTFKPYVSITLF
jgi:tetratricopeptide (TPR) repeat protein